MRSEDRGLTLRRRAYLLLAIGLGAGVLLSALALAQLQRLNSAHDVAVAAERSRADNAALMLALGTYQSDLRAYSSSALPEFGDRLPQDQAMVTQVEERLLLEAEDGEERSLEANLASAIVRWSGWAEARTSQVRASGRPLSDPAGTVEGDQRFQAVTAADQSLAAHLDEDSARSLAASTDAGLASVFLIGGGAGLGGLVLIVLGVTFFRSLLAPISRLAAAAHSMADGVPAAIEGTERNDEVGHLAQALLAWNEASSSRLEAVERFGAVFRDSALGIALLDLEGRVREANPAFVRLLEARPGDQIADLIRTDAPGWSRLEAVVAGRRPQLLVEGRRVAGGRTLWLRVVVSALGAGEARGLVAMVENITEERQSLSRLEALNEVGAAVLKGDRVEEALRPIAIWARRLAEGRLASIAVLTPDRDSLRVLAADGPGSERLTEDEVPLAGSLSGEAVRTLKSVASGDPVHDRRAFQPTAEKVGSGPFVAVPLERSGKAIGVVMVWRPVEAAPFAPAEIRLLQAFARQAAIALELGHAQERLRRLAVIAERERIARDLQDQVSQALFGISSALEATLTLAGDSPLAAQLEGSIVQLQKANRTVLDLVYGLHPALAAAAPLDLAARRLAEELGGEGRVSLEVDPEAVVELAPLREELIELARAGIAAAGHAPVHVRLTHRHGCAVVELDAEPDGPAPRHRLAALRRRTQSLKGRVDSRSGRDGGWHLQVTIPSPN